MAIHSQNQLMQDLAARWTQAQPTVAAFVSSLVPNFHDAEDVLQCVAIALVNKADGFDPSKPFVAWALGIARIEVLRFRSKAHQDRLVFDDQVIDRVFEAYQSTLAELEEKKGAMAWCVGQVQGKAGRVLELHYLREQKPAQVAQTLGMSANAVFVTLHRVRLALRECIRNRLALVK